MDLSPMERGMLATGELARPNLFDLVHPAGSGFGYLANAVITTAEAVDVLGPTSRTTTV